MPPVPWLDKLGSWVTSCNIRWFVVVKHLFLLSTQSQSQELHLSSHLFGIINICISLESPCNWGEGATIVKLHLTPLTLLLSASRLACATNPRPKKARPKKVVSHISFLWQAFLEQTSLQRNMHTVVSHYCTFFQQNLLTLLHLGSFNWWKPQIIDSPQ